MSTNTELIARLRAGSMPKGITEAAAKIEALPARLRGRASWLQELGRIRDSELMCDAATEIESLRKHVKEPK